MNKKFTVPKRISELSKRPINVEVILLEQEYMRLLDKGDKRNDFDEFLISYLHSRCDRVWKKISRGA